MDKSTASEETPQLLETTRSRHHPNCVVCSRNRPDGLGVCFVPRADGSVEADFECTGVLQGYDGLLHGGVTASLLDGAMTNCLFAHGLVALTAEMTVRFRRPIALDKPLRLSAEIADSEGPLLVLDARVEQDRHVMATARGKFIRRVPEWRLEETVPGQA